MHVVRSFVISAPGNDSHFVCDPVARENDREAVRAFAQKRLRHLERSHVTFVVILMFEEVGIG